MSSGTIFNFTQYGQDRLVMDWFALQDPFDQFVPIKVTNNWSGTLYFTWQLNSPPAWYGHFSGIPFSGTYGGGNGIAAGANATMAVQWNVSVSGQIDKSGPNLDNLTLALFAYSSGYFSGSIASGSLALKNVLFNRYSGVIKVFGDPYSSDQPTPTLATAANGTLASGQAYSYAISYFLSGWESDIGAPANTTIDNSGTNRTITVSWTGVASVTQYAVWRWSGGTDFTTAQGSVLSGTVDLVAIVSGTSITDSGISPLQTGMYRMRYWQGTTQIADNATFLSPPASRQWSTTTTGLDAHTFQLAKNISGVSLLGPFYVIFHLRGNLPGGTFSEFLNETSPQLTTTSGSLVADPNVFLRASTASWSRLGLYVSGLSSASNSGMVMLQFSNLQGINIDDVYVVANS